MVVIPGPTLNTIPGFFLKCMYYTEHTVYPLFIKCIPCCHQVYPLFGRIITIITSIITSFERLVKIFVQLNQQRVYVLLKNQGGA